MNKRIEYGGSGVVDDYIFEDHEMVVEECAFALEKIPERLFAPLFRFLEAPGGNRRKLALVFVVVLAVVVFRQRFGGG